MPFDYPLIPFEDITVPGVPTITAPAVTATTTTPITANSCQVNDVILPVTKTQLISRIEVLRQELLSLNKKRQTQEINSKNPNFGKCSQILLFKTICEEREKQQEVNY